MKKSFTIVVGGKAGQGAKATIDIMSRSFLRAGYHVYGNLEYFSIIRGGHNFVELRVSPEPVHAHEGTVDILIALDSLTIHKHLNRMREGSFIFYEKDLFTKPQQGIGPNREEERVNWDAIPARAEEKNITLFDLPLTKLAQKNNLKPIVKNTIAIGAAFALLNLDINNLFQSLKRLFTRKGKEVVSMNKKAAQAGWDYLKQNHKDNPKIAPPPAKKLGPRMILSGNEACVLGAIKAGCKFYTGYPMTPSSSMLDFSASLKKKYNIFAYQVEDEIAAAVMAIGASYSGVRSMTATSGGGFSLMTEALGLAAATETPLVLIDSQRGSPSTGLPTRVEQGDLQFVLDAGQGDSPRVVLAPGDARECYELVFHAFNLAEKFQLTVIILTDKAIAENVFTEEPFAHDNLKIDRGKILKDEDLSPDQEYKRFAITKDGISPRAIPGQPNAIFHVTGDENDERGFSSENIKNRERMVAKRMQKLESARAYVDKNLEPLQVFGNPKAKTALISWGSNKNVVREVTEDLNEQGADLKFIHVRFMMPFPNLQFEAALEGVTKTIDIEQNYTAQLARLIREETGRIVDERVLKYNGRPFSKRVLRKKLEEIL